MARNRNTRARRAAGALARKARREAKGSTAAKVEVKATISKSTGSKGLFSSKPTKQFARELINAIKENTRGQLDIRVQGYLLSPVAIYSDIRDENSPFRWPNSNGDKKIFSAMELRPIAKQISEEMYSFLRGKAIERGAIGVSGNPKEIIRQIQRNARNSKNQITLAYNDRRKIIYFWNAKKSSSALGRVNSFRAFTETFLTPNLKELVAKLPSSHPVTTYLQPDQEWLRIKETLSKELKESGASSRQKNERFSAERTKYKSRTGKSGYEGIQFGHTFGAAATTAAAFLANPHDLSHTYTPPDRETGVSSLKVREGFAKETEGRVLESIETTFKYDTRIKFEKRYSGSDIHGQLTLFISENAVSNVISGGQTTGPLRVLRNIVNQISDAILRWETSPSYNQMILEMIQDSFLGIKTPASSYSKEITVKGNKRKASLQVVGPKGYRGKPSYNEPKSPQGNTTNLASLINYLNRKLHDQIKENMGKGNAKQVLNYRTGRFARSAKIQTLYPINEKNAIGAQVRYMRNPYKVFEPGGSRLATPGRSPAKIFGKSIRQLLQEEKIANLRRVKVNLRG